MLGDASKAKRLLKWKPKIKFKDLVSEMIQNDINNTSIKILFCVMFDISKKKIWVAGHNGMVGSAIVRRLEAEDCKILKLPEKNLIF